MVYSKEELETLNVLTSDPVRRCHDKHRQRLDDLMVDRTTPYWLKRLITDTYDHDPVDVWVGLRAVMATYDALMADMQEAVEVLGLDS